MINNNVHRPSAGRTLRSYTSEGCALFIHSTIFQRTRKFGQSNAVYHQNYKIINVMQEFWGSSAALFKKAKKNILCLLEGCPPAV